MSEALKMADWLHHHPTQSNADKAAAMLRNQHAEIERLQDEAITWKVCYERTSDAARDLDAMLKDIRAENQKLREAVEGMAFVTTGEDCRCVARAALEQSRQVYYCANSN